MIKAEYIWIDGTEPSPSLRSKTRIIEELGETGPPVWGFDGSSTNQADGATSDCVLQPVRATPDPLRGGKHVLVLCEVFNPDGTPHDTNTRRACSETESTYSDQDPWFGLEQEYTLVQDGRPLGFPESGFPNPQGQYYCSVGGDNAFGRNIVEHHLEVCLQAGLKISGVNAEVMPGQWEFQVGPLGAVAVSDQLWLARYLLERVAEFHECAVSWHPKPVRGDWNGAGCHTNFSTVAMRTEKGLYKKAAEALREPAATHIANYGYGIEQRLTGRHETCSYEEFRWGVSDRGASVRVPWQVANDGVGYIEDRRPNANCDPYVVTDLIVGPVCAALQ